MGELLTALVALVHAGVGAVWLGSMAYSLFVVQPRVGRLLPKDTAEDVYRELANGNRWRVVALIAVLALSGLGLVLAPDGKPALWWAPSSAGSGWSRSRCAGSSVPASRWAFLPATSASAAEKSCP
jgi:hypothetical protein